MKTNSIDPLAARWFVPITLAIGLVIGSAKAWVWARSGAGLDEPTIHQSGYMTGLVLKGVVQFALLILPGLFLARFLVRRRDRR